jgi:hypothetical protein
MSAVDTRPFDQLWRDRVADFLMAEGPFAAAGEPSGQVDASAQLLTKPWDNDAYDRVGMPAPSRTGAATSTGGVDAQTGWNRYLAQALRDYGTVPTPAADPRPFDQLWRERSADAVMAYERPAFAATGAANTGEGLTRPLSPPPVADTPADWNRHLAQALRDYPSAAGARPFDRPWRERLADAVMAYERPATAGERSGQVGPSVQPMMRVAGTGAWFGSGTPARAMSRLASDPGSLRSHALWRCGKNTSTSEKRFISKQWGGPPGAKSHRSEYQERYPRCLPPPFSNGVGNVGRSGRSSG